MWVACIFERKGIPYRHQCIFGTDVHLVGQHLHFAVPAVVAKAYGGVERCVGRQIGQVVAREGVGAGPFDDKALGVVLYIVDVVRYGRIGTAAAALAFQLAGVGHGCQGAESRCCAGTQCTLFAAGASNKAVPLRIGCTADEFKVRRVLQAHAVLVLRIAGPAALCPDAVAQAQGQANCHKQCQFLFIHSGQILKLLLK